MDLKTPFEALRNSTFENLSEARENSRFNFKRADSYVTWIAGFSIVAISYIATNRSSLSATYSHYSLKAVLILLAISIVSGIVTRWTAIQMLAKSQTAEFMLKGYFSNKEMMFPLDDPIEDEETADKIKMRIKNEFGDYFIIPETEDLEILRKRYRELAKFTREDVQRAIKFVEDGMEKFLGVTPNKLKRLGETNKARLLCYQKASAISFVCCVIPFILVILILCFGY